MPAPGVPDHSVPVTSPVGQVPGDLPRERSREAEDNARLTAITGLLILTLFVIEVVTVVLGVAGVLSLHVTIGLLLVPPVLLKLASTSWRMVNYYREVSPHRQLGPPPLLLRILSPMLAIVVVLLLATGIALIVGLRSIHSGVLSVHKVTFYLGLLLIAIHLGAHFIQAVNLAGRDLLSGRTPSASRRRYRWAAVITCLLLGVVLAVGLSGHASPYLHHYYSRYPHH